MPQESYKKNGETVYNDTFHAVTAEARTALVDAVNDAYEQKLQDAWEAERDAPAHGMEQRCKRHGVEGGDGTWCDSPWITEIGSSFTAILWAM